MRILVTYSNGKSLDIDESEVIYIRNYPVSETQKPGYERTRDYPPEWSRFSPLRAGVLAVGHYVNTSDGVLKVVELTDITEPKA